MRNLFILHTQYNIILAVAVILENFGGCTNDLLLHAEFRLNDLFLDQLKLIFENVWVVQKEFDSSGWGRRLHGFREKMKLAAPATKHKYETVFTAQEQYFDTLILTKISHNAKFRYCSVEEDAYFSLSRNMNLEPPVFKKENITIKCGRCLYFMVLDLIYGKNEYYKQGNCYGMNPNIHAAYLTFPGLVRKEIKGKEIHGINTESLLKGIRAIYHENHYPNNSVTNVVFFFDLLSRYHNVIAMISIVDKIVSICKKNGITFIYKYHPREIDQISQLEKDPECIMLPAIVPSEKVLADMIGTETIVIGYATTAIQIAKKLGFKVVSVAAIDMCENEFIINALKRMEIRVPSNEEEIEGEILGKAGGGAEDC